MVDIKAIEEHLAEIDKKCIEAGEPILSVLVRTDEGHISPVTLATIMKYKLILPHESLTEAVLRLQREAFAYAQRKT